ncbi:uncharacterized protein TM35_000292340 [Trypanosoma theileri]|uniref:Uncharacterized protein n=1 Tax=Trypanosoma theileri TaxID=67003 RepID=A0A1X0NNQ4_9TRYP|nr:uncharacterized protein TM35_000292340 [Trypanosoma theileri]ORC86352.1 hypothetical protein TM35_000292340 [Trypanosoma theileri]
MLRAQYGTVTEAHITLEDDDLKNPGTVEFDEELLNDATKAAFAEQLWVSAMQLLMPLKLLLVLIILPLLLVMQLFFPSGATADAVCWLLALAAVMPINVVLVEYMDDIATRFNSDEMAAVIRIFAEHAAELLVSFLSLSHRGGQQALWVKPLLFGCMLASTLITVGVGLLFAIPSESTYRFGASVWRNFRSLLVFTSVCFVLPTLYSVSARISQVGNNRNPGAEVALTQVTDDLQMSRFLALLAIGVYVSVLATGLGSRTHLYTSAGNAVTPTSLTYVIQYLHTGQEYKDACPIFETRYSIDFAITGAILTFTLLLAVCHILVDKMVQASHLLFMPLPFVVVVLMPLVLRGGSVCGAAFMASVGRLDIAVCMGLSSALRIFHIVLPLVVLIAWPLGHPVDLVLHPFLAGVCLLLIVMVSHLGSEGTLQRVDGIVLVAFYALVTCACLLGGSKAVMLGM